MVNDKEIIRVLTEAGDVGLSVSKIARHVYNASNTFFDSVELEDVYRYVSSWIYKNSKSVDAIIEKTERGVYRLNPNSKETRQLMLQFNDMDEEQKDEKPQIDLSLSLFD